MSERVTRHLTQWARRLRDLAGSTYAKAKAKWILTKPQVAGTLIASTILGVWMFGAETEDRIVVVTKQQIDNHISTYHGIGIAPDALEGRNRIQVGSFARVYTSRRVCEGAIVGVVVGLGLLVAVNSLLTRVAPREKPKEEADKEPEGKQSE